MSTVEQWLDTIAVDDNRAFARKVLDWIGATYPDLRCEIKWKQPMFIADKTFIIGFSHSKDNLLVAPEVIEPYQEAIVAAGYTHGKKLFRIPFAGEVNYELLAQIIDTNIEEKKGSTRFWR
ncbi:hypothetical protein CAQU_04105 [Corynebacterium aquilae DSM 44791]|uniref:YdhG-like domain-containing protein n=1 Tax=Corynebacterium aquilae DSM 44791 TaxID=1431546 RepID=A0A1L7CEW0_9CORY|nr:hypothetical protein CAQU_04105 [Corynebacterium aquilae DSM 44791]